MIQSSAPTAGAAAWTVGHVTPAEGLTANLRGISCPTADPLRRGRLQRRRLDDHQPGRSAPASWTPTKIPKVKSLFGVSCISDSPVRAGRQRPASSSPRPTRPAARPPGRAPCCPAARRCARSAAPARSAWRAPSTAKSGRTARARKAACGLDPGRPAGGRTADARADLPERNALRRRRRRQPSSSRPPRPPASRPGRSRRCSRRFQIVAASCPRASLCVLSSNNGEVTASTNPTRRLGDLAHRTPDQRRHQRPLRPLLPERNALRRGGQIRPDPDHDPARRHRPAGTAAAPPAADHRPHARAAQN